MDTVDCPCQTMKLDQEPQGVAFVKFGLLHVLAQVPLCVRKQYEVSLFLCPSCQVHDDMGMRVLMKLFQDGEFTVKVLISYFRSVSIFFESKASIRVL